VEVSGVTPLDPSGFKRFFSAEWVSGWYLL
jgi:hypothetical protein